MSDIFQNNPLAIDHDELLSIRLLLGMLSKLIGENAPQFNQAFLEVGEHPAKLWLINLWATSDFTSGSTETKKRLAEVVLNAFKYASEHEDFQEWFSLFLDTANISCVDRTALSLIDLEILIESKRLSTIQDPLVARAFLKNAWATYLLHQLAKETMKERPGLDELDVHLAYLIGCKKPLEKLGIQLPFSSEKMMFFEITNLTKDDLSGAVQRVQEKMNSPKTLQDFVEFLSLEDDVVAKFCLTLFKNLFAEEIENVTKAAEERQGLVEDFIGAINEDELNPKSVQDSSLPSEIKSLLLKKPFRDVDQEQVYEELNKLNKDPYLLLAAKYIFNVQAT